MRLLAISTTSLPLNFFSNSRTSRSWILLKDRFKRYGTFTRTVEHVNWCDYTANKMSECLK